MTVQRNRIYYFLKSGNRVRTVEPTVYGGRDNWVVRRVDGTSAGKEMVVPGRALAAVWTESIDDTRSISASEAPG